MTALLVWWVLARAHELGPILAHRDNFDTWREFWCVSDACPATLIPSSNHEVRYRRSESNQTNGAGDRHENQGIGVEGFQEASLTQLRHECRRDHQHQADGDGLPSVARFGNPLTRT